MTSAAPSRVRGHTSPGSRNDPEYPAPNEAGLAPRIGRRPAIRQLRGRVARVHRRPTQLSRDHSADVSHELQLEVRQGMGSESVLPHVLTLTSPRNYRAFASTALIAVGIVSRVRASDPELLSAAANVQGLRAQRIEGIPPSRPHAYELCP